jgi:putative iron-regulated protein
MKLSKRLGVAVSCVVVSACSSSSPSSSSPVTAAMTSAVLDTYATNLYSAYSDAVTDENAFAQQVATFLANPTEDALADSRTAWLASRAHYMLTEGARFYGGPIDAEPPANGGYEAEINSWPLDEAYVDYSTDPATGVIDDTMGLVNTPSALPMITVDAVDALNAQGGDDNISDGYHAQEFLLWGQALQAVGPGQRPATDYMPGGPRPNVDRRSEYLTVVTQGILAHLTAVRDAWAPGAAYRTQFVQGGLASVALALDGLGRMSKGELAGQRIDAPYTSKSRRDQHDCFSSDTLTDYLRDAQGLEDIYLGTYGTNDGPGFDTLVTAANPGIDSQLQTQLQTSVTAMAAIPGPFEQAIVGDDSDAGRTAIRAVVASLRAQGDQFAQAAAALGQTIAVPDTNE